MKGTIRRQRLCQKRHDDLLQMSLKERLLQCELVDWQYLLAANGSRPRPDEHPFFKETRAPL